MKNLQMTLSRLLQPDVLSAGLLLILVIIASLRKLTRRLDTATTWRSYLQEQGAMLFLFLILGGAVGWVGIHLSQDRSEIKADGRLIEYRQVDLAEHAAYQDLDLSGFTQITVYAKSTAPQSSRISIRLIPGEGDATQRSVSFEATDSTWVRLQEPVSSKRLAVVIESVQAGMTRATQADVLVFLSRP